NFNEPGLENAGKINESRFQAGDEILLARGRTWYEQLNVSSSGAANASLTIGAYGTGEQPLIDAQGIRNRGISIVGKSYVVVTDLAIRNSTSFAIEIFNSGHITVANCAIRNAKESAIQVGGISPSVSIDHCN